MKLTLAFSPCPNDTFIFDAMVHHKVDTEGLEFDVRLEDVETLNNLAMEGRTEMTKVSYHAWLYLTETYTLLDSGSAIGKGNGPLLISKNNFSTEELRTRTIAVPGEYTTAHLLLKIASPELKLKKFMVFSEIEQAILDGSVDAGVIIHENRFTYADKGLLKIADLGDLWEQRTHLPIPLGGIVALKNLGQDTINKLNRVMYRSVKFALDHPDNTMDYVRAHAQEMNEEVMKKHIGLYVNNYTLSLGEIGRQSVQKLFEYTGIK